MEVATDWHILDRLLVANFCVALRISRCNCERWVTVPRSAFSGGESRSEEGSVEWAVRRREVWPLRERMISWSMVWATG